MWTWPLCRLCSVLQAVCTGGVHQVLTWGCFLIFLFEERQMEKMK